MSTPRVELTEAELREGLTTCLAVPRWVDEIVAAAPFGSMLELLDAAAAAANPLTVAEIDQALAHHPRVGGRLAGPGPAPSAAGVEQETSASEDAELAQALARGQQAYEERFGRVFLIRSAGRTRSDVLRELERRLRLEPDAEVDVVAAELRDIALSRIPQLFAHLDHHSGYADAEAAE